MIVENHIEIKCPAILSEYYGERSGEVCGHLNNFEVEGEGRYQKHCEWCGALILFSVRVKIIKEVRLDSDPVEVKAYEKRIRSSDYEEN